jgi:hypothetical protein
MNFLIGNLTPNDPNEPIYNYDGDETITPNDPNKDESKEDPPKKTNWVLYGLLGLVALSIILGNKK